MFNKGRRHNKLERGDPSLALHSVQVDTWGPFIFVNLDAKNTVSLSSYLGDLIPKYPRYFKSGRSSLPFVRFLTLCQTTKRLM